MKKFLLIALAAFTVGTANAQFAQKPTGKKNVAKQVVSAQSTSKKYAPVAAKAVKPVLDKTTKVFNHNAVSFKNLKNLSAQRAGTPAQTYNAFGTDSDGASQNWEMTSGTATINEVETKVLTNVLPNIFGFEEGVTVPYSLDESGNIVIQPTLIASAKNESSPSGMLYIFLESATSSDGSITLTLNENGGIDGKYNLLYGCYPNETYNYEEYLGLYERYSNVGYYLPGQIAAPVVSFEPANLVLFAGLGLSGYSYTSNLAMTGAYATTSFANATIDPATAWAWTVYQEEGEGENVKDVVYQESTEKNFSLNLTNEYVKNVSLVGTNVDQNSNPFIFGVGKCKKDDQSAKYTESYLYAGNAGDSFTFTDGSSAIMTRQDPDGDLTFYTNWGTPDKASNSMSKIYMYHEKPASPLYIEGVTLPMVGFSANEDFNLHMKIYEVESYAGSKPVLGNVIAESDATSEDINSQYDAGLTAVEFTSLYKEDEDGLSTDISYLFLDKEFVIVIEGWDNKTFSGVLGSQDAPLDNARTSTWFEMTGEEGSMYSYTTWKTSLFVGFLGATYGYLHTTDNTTINVATTGGDATINVEAMMRSQTEEQTSEPRLFVDNITMDESSSINEETGLPSWLNVEVVNVSEDAYKFGIKFTASALPTEITGRYATITFMQEGALLPVTIVQGENLTGVESVKAVKAENGTAYNLAGQRVSDSFKGLVIKDGKKMMVK